MTATSRIAAIALFVFLLTLGYATNGGRVTAIALVAVAIVSALTYYGHRATTLYLAERHRALLAQTRGTR